MAWVRVRKIQDDFSDKVSSTGTGASEGGATQKFYCEADGAVAGDAAMTANDGSTAVPALGASYSTGRPFCTVRDRKVERLSSSQFNVTVEFADPSGGGGDATSPEDLLGLPAKIRRSAEEYNEAYTKDVTGKVVRNSAGDPFDRAPERLTGVGVFSIQKYVDAAGRSAIDALWNTTNSGAITIDGVSCAADTCWLTQPAFDPVNGATGVYSATYVVKYKKLGWKQTILDYGFSVILPAKGRITEPVLKEDGTVDATQKPRPCTLPWPLDGAGAKKANKTDDPAPIVFTPYTSTSWAGLPVT